MKAFSIKKTPLAFVSYGGVVGFVVGHDEFYCFALVFHFVGDGVTVGLSD